MSPTLGISAATAAWKGLLVSEAATISGNGRIKKVFMPPIYTSCANRLPDEVDNMRTGS